MPSLPPRGTDFLEKYPAYQMAAFIQDFWHSRGHTNVVVERYELDIPGVYGVRSNLVGGLPPTQTGDV
jgi:hypothetical protein